MGGGGGGSSSNGGGIDFGSMHDLAQVQNLQQSLQIAKGLLKEQKEALADKSGQLETQRHVAQFQSELIAKLEGARDAALAAKEGALAEGGRAREAVGFLSTKVTSLEGALAAKGRECEESQARYQDLAKALEHSQQRVAEGVKAGALADSRAAELKAQLRTAQEAFRDAETRLKALQGEVERRDRVEASSAGAGGAARLGG